MIKKIIKNLLPNWFWNFYNESEIYWNLTLKSSIPPNSYKRRNLQELCRKYQFENFIETGTYLGLTTVLIAEIIENIYTFEPYAPLYKNLEKKFSNFKNITLIKSESEKGLPELLKKINKNSIYYLDAHYSGDGTYFGDLETPIMKEIELILKSNKFKLIVIDDARNFGSVPDYPTIKFLEQYVLSQSSHYNFYVKYDQIYILNENKNNK